MFFGKGGYDWDTVYSMPIWLRRFTFHQLDEYYKKEQEEYRKANGGSELITANKPLAKPGIPEQKPTYTSKVSRK